MNKINIIGLFIDLETTFVQTDPLWTFGVRALLKTFVTFLIKFDLCMILFVVGKKRERWPQKRFQGSTGEEEMRSLSLVRWASLLADSGRATQSTSKYLFFSALLGLASFSWFTFFLNSSKNTVKKEEKKRRYQSQKKACKIWVDKKESDYSQKKDWSLFFQKKIVFFFWIVFI